MAVASLLNSAAVLLALAAMGGLVMLYQRFGQHRNPPTWLAMAHGFLAAAGVTLLLYAWVFAGVSGSVKLSRLFLLIGSLGGAILNLRDHWNRILLTRSWVVGHMVAVLIGFGILAREVWFLN